jgi:undecaprenyl diphosphate synthase
LWICYLTLYAFSSENWGRPEQEVTDLMGLLQYYLEKELPLLHEQQIRLKVMGDFSQLSGQMVEKVHAAMEATAKYTTMTLTIALSYGSRQEILHAVKKMLESGISAEELTEESFSAQLYTHDVPDPDLLIRTGGEQRLSNFLLWQSAYTELYFTPTLWPDFDARHLHEAVLAFSKRERRFGHV